MEIEIEGNQGTILGYLSRSTTKVKHSGQGSQVLILNFGLPIAKPVPGTDPFHKELVERISNQSGWTVLSILCSGIEIRYIRIDDNGYLILDEIDKILEDAKVLSVTLTSNVLGTLNPVAKLAGLAHKIGAIVIGDGAQYVPHICNHVPLRLGKEADPLAALPCPKGRQSRSGQASYGR